MQHLSLPHCPASFCGLRDRSWHLADWVEMDWKLVMYLEQQSERPHTPIPPIRPASCLAPICFISILIRNSSGEDFDQLSEIDPFVSDIVEDGLGTVTLELHVTYLHVQLHVGSDLAGPYHGTVLAGYGFLPFF